jgi:prefoldin alpha subunit
MSVSILNGPNLGDSLAQPHHSSLRNFEIYSPSGFFNLTTLRKFAYSYNSRIQSKMSSSSPSQPQPPENAIDLATLPVPSLSQLQQRLQSDLTHLSTSHTRLRAAQSRFKDCIHSIKTGVQPSPDQPSPKPRPLLIPLTSSLYVPGVLASDETVLVDVGTGFYVEKSCEDAVKFYQKKVEELQGNMIQIEGVVQGKTETLRGVEEVLRQKVLAQQHHQSGGEGEGGKG